MLLAVILSIIWLLSVASRPRGAVLGRASGVRGFHSLADFPNATTVPGLLLYRFEGGIVFFNAHYFKEQVLESVAGARAPVEWVVIDSSPINVIDFTGLQKVEELREELAARGIDLYFAHARRSLELFFNPAWIARNSEQRANRTYPTLKAAVHAFTKRHEGSDPLGPIAPPAGGEGSTA